MQNIERFQGPHPVFMPMCSSWGSHTTQDACGVRSQIFQFCEGSETHSKGEECQPSLRTKVRPDFKILQLPLSPSHFFSLLSLPFSPHLRPYLPNSMWKMSYYFHEKKMPLKKKMLTSVQFRHAFQNLTGSKDKFCMFRWFSLSLWSDCFRLARNSLCRQSRFWTHRNLPISNSPVLGLKTYNTTSGRMFSSSSSSPCLLVLAPWPWEALKSGGGVFINTEVQDSHCEIMSST